MQEALLENMVPERDTDTKNFKACRETSSQSYLTRTLSAALLEDCLNNLQRMHKNETKACKSAVPNSSNQSLVGKHDVTARNSTESSHLTLADECPTRDPGISKFDISVGIRYLENLTGRLKEAFTVNSKPKEYDHNQCQNYRRRLEQHNLLFHQGRSVSQRQLLCDTAVGSQHSSLPKPSLMVADGCSETFAGKVSSVHATQTITPLKRDRCLEFQVPKLSFASQVQGPLKANVSADFHKTTNTDKFKKRADQSIATSVVSSVLGETSESSQIDYFDDQSDFEVASVSVKSFMYTWENEQQDENKEENEPSEFNLALTDNEENLKHRLYEKILRVEFEEWLNEKPVFFSQQETTKSLREFLVKKLIIKLVEISDKVKEDSYNLTVKGLVEDCVSDLPMLCPGSKDDQMNFKKRLVENLFDKIRHSNESIFSVSDIKCNGKQTEYTNGDSEVAETYDPSNLDLYGGRNLEEIITLTIIRWIDSDVIKLHSNFSPFEISNTLIKALEYFQILGPNSFEILSNKVFEILDDLPIKVCSDIDKALTLFKLSEELADIICHHTTLNEKESIVPRGCTSESIPHKLAISHEEIKNIIRVGVKIRLRRFKINDDEDTVNNITEVLANILNENCSRTKLEKPFKRICTLLEKNLQSKNDIAEVALNLINCVQALPVAYQKQMYLEHNFNIDNLPISNTLMVFRNELEEETYQKDPRDTTLYKNQLKGERYPKNLGYSTPKRNQNNTPFQPDVSAIGIYDFPATLSPEANAYLNVVEKEIEKWVNSIKEFKFISPVDLKFKKTMIKDLAADVLDRAKFKQVHKTSNEEEINHMRFTIFRWIWRISEKHPLDTEDEELNEKIVQLVNILKDLPQPNLAQPYLGNRKDMKVETGQVPTGVDILEDEISIFLNEYPPDIFVNKNKSARNSLIHELATNVQKYMLTDQNPDENIENELNGWLPKVIKPENKKVNPSDIKRRLKERIGKVPKNVHDVNINQLQNNNYIQRNINHGTDWLKEQPFYQECTPQNKLDQEQRIATMIKDLLQLQVILSCWSVKPEKQGPQILSELVDHFKYFPMNNGLRMGDNLALEEIQGIAIPFFKYLQEMRECDLALPREPIPNTSSSGIATDMTRQKPQSLIDMKDESTLDERKQRSSVSFKSRTSLVESATKPPCICLVPEDEPVKTIIMDNLETFQNGDTTTKEALAGCLVEELEKVELKSCDMPKCKHSCSNITKNGTDMVRVNEELVIIKSIIEWLQTVTLVDGFYSPDNHDRTKLISDLAEKIYNSMNDLESPDGPNVLQIIEAWMPNLPLMPEYQQPLMLDTMSRGLENRIEKNLCANKRISQSLKQDTTIEQSTKSIVEQTNRSDALKLEDFVETYMILNPNIDISNDILREAYAYKLVQALKIFIRQLKEPAKDRFELYDAIIDVPMPGDQSVIMNTREKRLEKEVNEWLSHLPTVPADKGEQDWRYKQCKMLIKHIHNTQTDNPLDKIKYERELRNNIIVILDHVLEPGHECEFEEYIEAFQKIQFDVGSLATETPEAQPTCIDSQDETQFDKSIALHKHYDPYDSIDYDDFSAHVPGTSSKTDFHAQKKTLKTSDVLYEAIEKWSEIVPIEQHEVSRETIRENLVQAVFIKVGQLNLDPNYSNMSLYNAALSDFIEELLDTMPQTAALRNRKEQLKEKLIKDVSEANVMLKNLNAGENYKKKLKDGIQVAVLKPQVKEQTAVVDLIKTIVAEEFILDKYQNGDEELQKQYESTVLNELTKVIDTDAFSQSNVDEVYNSIMHQLDTVPPPDIESIAQQVELIKTKYIISEWFKELPLNPPQDSEEILDRDGIQTFLAKRCHEIEKERGSTDVMMAVIKKWILKLPLQSGQERLVDDFANNLIERLELTEVSRQATLKDSTRRLSKQGQKERTMRDPFDSVKSASLYSDTEKEETLDFANKNCTEIIFEIVQSWCQQLPLEEVEGDKEFKTKLAAKILFKIGELNRDDLIFSDEILYRDELADMIDKIVSSLSENPCSIKMVPIESLVEQIIRIRPCIKNEKERYNYKQQLNNTVTQLVRQQEGATVVEQASFKTFQEKIVDEFVEYNYHTDEPAKRKYKEKILCESKNFLHSTCNENPEATTQALFNELSKVPVPDEEIVREEVQEINLKEQISDWMEEIPLPCADPVEEEHRNKIKGVLAKHINEIENEGIANNQGNCVPDVQKIRAEITKYTKKLFGEEVSDQIVDEQVNALAERLNKTEQERRRSSITHGASALQAKRGNQSLGLERLNRTGPIRRHTPPLVQADQGFQAKASNQSFLPTGPTNQSSCKCPQQKSPQKSQIIPVCGSFTSGEDYASNTSTNIDMICPSYSTLDNDGNSKAHLVDDEELPLCPYQSRHLENRSLKPKRNSTQLNRGSAKTKLPSCLCLDTGDLLSVVPCPIHERVSSSRGRSNCNTR